MQEEINHHSIYGDNECSDPENFLLGCIEEIEYEFHNFKSFEKRIEKFEQDLRIFEKESDNLFFKAILSSICYALLHDKNEFEFIHDHEKLLRIFGENFLSKFQLLKPELKLNLCLNTFKSQCHIIYDLLMKKNLFLRV